MYKCSKMNWSSIALAVEANNHLVNIVFYVTIIFCRGFAFVTFKSPEAVSAVIDKNNKGGHTLDGKMVIYSFYIVFELLCT